MIKLWALLLALLAFAAPVQAQQISDCDARAAAENIPEPWEDATRSFANGAVRLAVLDTIEPAAAAFHILVLSPPYDVLGARQCRIVSFAQGAGFGAATLTGMSSRYDPAVGLIFGIKVGQYDVANGGTKPATLRLSLNQTTGALNAALR